MAASSGEFQIDVISSRYDDLVKWLVSNPDLLSSLSERFQETSVVDAETSQIIATTPSSDGARLLLDVLSMRLDQSADYEPLIIGILKENNDLDLEKILAVELTSGLATSNVPDLPTHKVSIWSDTNMPSSIDSLKKSFDSLLAKISDIEQDINLPCLKARISLCFQTPGQQDKANQCLHDVNAFSSVMSVIEFLRNENLLSCLNCKLLDAIRSTIPNTAIEFHEQYKRYQIEYEAFMMNKFDIVAESFTELSFKCSLPEIVVNLPAVSSLKKEPFSYWQKILKSHVTWSENIMTKSVEIHSDTITITYYVLPFILSKVVKDLTNIEIQRKLTAVNAAFSISEELKKQAIDNDTNVILEIQNALSQMKVSESDTTQNAATGGAHTVSFSGGYNIELFLSKPPETLECPVCLNILKEPINLSCGCGAVICKGCHHLQNCPKCRRKIERFMIDKNRKRQIGSLKVKCTIDGCYWTGTLNNLQQHQEGQTCPITKEKQEEEDKKQRMNTHIERTAEKQRKVTEIRLSQMNQESQDDMLRDEEISRDSLCLHVHLLNDIFVILN